MKNDPAHEAEWQPTKDFVDSDGTNTMALAEYLKEQSLLLEQLRLSDTHDINRKWAAWSAT